MKLHSLKPASGSVKRSKRIGRGQGSGRGGTSTRGHKGAKSRSGYSQKRAFEGGQMPLQMRLPKRGFKNSHRRYKTYRPDEYVTLNLHHLEEIAKKHGVTEITPEILRSLDILSNNATLKILADGALTQGLQVSAQRFSASAKEAIANAGGKTFIIFKLNQLQGIAHVENTDKVDLALIRKHFDFVTENDNIHVVAEGAISQKLTIEVSKISDDAKAGVEAQGGSVVLV